MTEEETKEVPVEAVEDEHPKGIVEHYAKALAPRWPVFCITGCIGVGKTSLCAWLAKELNALPFYEPVKNNPYLPLFYKDMKKYSFAMQVFLLVSRFRLHQQGIWADQAVVYDSVYLADSVFPKMLRECGLMNELDFQTYRLLFNVFANFLHRPDLIIYLDIEPEKALDRIKMRSRDCETTMTLEYLTELKKAYEEWLADIEPRIPVLRLDWNEFHPTEYVIHQIQKKLKESRKGIVV